MFKDLEYLYQNKQLDIEELRRAVIQAWITVLQFLEITGQNY